MPTQARLAPRRSAEELKLDIESFLAASRQPTLFEPGEAPITLLPSSTQLQIRNHQLTLSAFDDSRNLVRRICGVRDHSRGRIELEVERFGPRSGTIVLADMALSRNEPMNKRTTRLINREQFRRGLARQFPGWAIHELTSEPDLHHSLSPSYPRAYLRKGRRGFAALCAVHAIPSALTFGLLWLHHLRSRERQYTVEGLALFVPAGSENDQALRMKYLDPSLGRYGLYVISADGYEEKIDLADTGNIDTYVEPLTFRAELPNQEHDQLERAIQTDAPFAERISGPKGLVSFRIRGLEFARRTENEFLFGFETKRAATTSHLAEIKELAALMNQLRSPEAGAGTAKSGPLYTRYPERWLESQVRADVETLDASLLPDPVYGQVPAFGGEGRDVLDLLASTRDGRLVVIELKASEDIHLPVQGLDYWIRVKHHLDRGDFQANHYFPGSHLRSDPPKLLFVSPALEVHPTNEIVMGYFSQEVDAEQIGLSVEWRKGVDVMFRRDRNIHR